MYTRDNRTQLRRYRMAGGAAQSTSFWSSRPGWHTGMGAFTRDNRTALRRYRTNNGPAQEGTYRAWRAGKGLYEQLGDASSCSADQEWDPGCIFNGITGQCVPKGTVGKNPQCTYQQGSSGGGTDWGKLLGQIGGGVISGLTSKPATAPVQTVVSDGGMSTTTKIALAGAGLIAVVLIMRSRKSAA